MGQGLRRWLSAGLVAALMVGAALPASAGSARAMWVWDAPDAGLIDFSIANGVTDLYLHLSPGFSSDASVASFLTDAHTAGLEVHAMAGDPAWASDSGAWTTWVDEVVAHGGFDGMVFDVEPYLHPDWATKKQNRLIRSFLSGLDEAARRAGGLPVLAAVPFWFDGITVKRDPLVQHVLAATDGIVVMAYRDHALGVDGILDVAATEAWLAASMGRLFVVGVETAPAGLDKVTFAEEGRQFMESELGMVEAELASNSGFGGFAIHHYDSYAGMAP